MPVAPVKVVALAEAIFSVRTKCGSRIEQAVEDVYGKDAESDDCGCFQRQARSGGPCEAEGPDQGDCWRIEAGEMPEVQRARRDRGATSCMWARVWVEQSGWHRGLFGTVAQPKL